MVTPPPPPPTDTGDITLRTVAGSDAENFVRELAARFLVPPPRLTVDQWADKHRYVPAMTSSRPGPWRTDNVPFAREPMRCFTDPDVREVVLMFGTQICKTELMLNCVLYTVDCRPRPTLWVMESEKTTLSFSKKRLHNVIEQTPKIRDHLGGPHDTNITNIAFDSMFLRLGWAGSSGQLSSDPAGVGVADEIDKWSAEVKGKGRTEGSALDLVRSRLDSFDDSKLLIASTPTDENVGIHAEYLRTDQATFRVPCPHCAHYQRLILPQVRWDNAPDGTRLGDTLDDAECEQFCEHVRLTAWYECESCKGRIENHHKHEMMRRGVWARAGQRVRAAADGSAVIEGEPPRTSRRGFHLSQLYPLHKTFGDVAYGFVRSGGKPDRAFINTVLAEPWVARSATVRDEELFAIVASNPSEVEIPRYARGTVPDEALMLTVQVDVQPGEAWWIISGWGMAERHYLIDWGLAPYPETARARDVSEMGTEELQAYRELLADNAAAVLALLDRRFPRAHDDTELVPVAFGMIDSGYRTKEIYQLCDRVGSMLKPYKGDTSQTRMIKITKVDDLRKNGIARAVDLVLASSDGYSTELYQRMMRRPPMRGAWHWPVEMEDPNNNPDARALLRSMTSEHRVPCVRHGVKAHMWKLRPGRSDNHWRDCAKMGLALAEVLGVYEWESIPQGKRHLLLDPWRQTQKAAADPAEQDVHFEL